MKCPKCGHRKAKDKSCKFCHRISVEKYGRSVKGKINHIMRVIRIRVKKGEVPPPEFTFMELLEYVEGGYSLKGQHFWPLYEKWKKSGYKTGLGPSLDRIDPLKGYTWDNVQWMTWDENRAKGRTEDKKIHKQARDELDEYSDLSF